jgi:hypothetical protein
MSTQANNPEEQDIEQSRAKDEMKWSIQEVRGRGGIGNLSSYPMGYTKSPSLSSSTWNTKDGSFGKQGERPRDMKRKAGKSIVKLMRFLSNVTFGRKLRTKMIIPESFDGEKGGGKGRKQDKQSGC